jgi:hypothetical protein
MRGIFVWRGLGIALTALSFNVLCGSLVRAEDCKKICWINAKTGEAVSTVPLSGANLVASPANAGAAGVALLDGLDRNSNHATNNRTGETFVRQSDGSWINAKTGICVPTVPLSGANLVGSPANAGAAGVALLDGLDRNSNHAANNRSGETFVRVPCPPPSTASSTVGGGYLGGELVKNWGRVRSTETRDATGVITNQFIDSGDPLGVGIVGGYNFKPWNNNFVIGPFASFDYLNQTINHNFAGGQFLGTTTHWFINAGVKAGVVTAPGFYLYGLAGAAFLNHDLNVNFATAAQSNTTTPGFTLGLGGEYQPSSWQLAGHPVSVFAQYEHTWWSNANFNTPTSSPAFNYAFRREDDTIKLGVNFYFGAAPAPASSPAYPVKAPMLK